MIGKFVVVNVNGTLVNGIVVAESGDFVSVLIWPDIHGGLVANGKYSVVIVNMSSVQE